MNSDKASSDGDRADRSWKSLYRISGIAALISTVLFLSDLIVLPLGGEAPDSGLAWIRLFLEDRTAGLLQLFFSDLIGVALVAPVAVALYGLLRRTNPAYAALSVALVLLGIAAVLAANPNYSLIRLSERYAAAATETERAAVAAAAEAFFTNGMGGTALFMANLIIETGLLAYSLIMLRDSRFGRWTAYFGIIGHGLDLLHILPVLVLIPLASTEAAWKIGEPILLAGGVFQLLWYPLVGRRLLQLGR